MKIYLWCVLGVLSTGIYIPEVPHNNFSNDFFCHQFPDDQMTPCPNEIMEIFLFSF